ncbi:MAG: ribonuclease P protein component [Puniceicoccales bacterium]|nr:ribonuclease P protein component [Puniceicoccales bacterium]
MDQRLRRCQRISSRADFLAFRSQRTIPGGVGLRAVGKRGPGRWPRLAIVAPRRIGNAVRRNHLKRIVREEFRRHAGSELTGWDLLVLLNESSRGLADGPLRAGLRQILRRLLEQRLKICDRQEWGKF